MLYVHGHAPCMATPLYGRTPCMATCWAGAGLTVEWSEADQKKKVINVPADIYEQGCIADVEAGLLVGTRTPARDDGLPHGSD